MYLRTYGRTVVQRHLYVLALQCRDKNCAMEVHGNGKTLHIGLAIHSWV